MKQFFYNLITKMENGYISIKDFLISKYAFLKIKLINAFSLIINWLKVEVFQFVSDILGILICIVIAIIFLTHIIHRHENKKPSVISEVAPVVKSEPKVDIVPNKPIKVYKHNKKIKTEVKLPDAVVQDDNKQVLTVAKVADAKDNEAKNVTTVLDLNTGNVTDYIQPEPTPFIAVNKHGEIGMYAGIKNGQGAIRLQANQNLISVKDIDVSAIGSVDQLSSGKTDYFVGVGASYKW
jgi:hypothetical protein